MKNEKSKCHVRINGKIIKKRKYYVERKIERNQEKQKYNRGLKKEKIKEKKN